MCVKKAVNKCQHKRQSVTWYLQLSQLCHLRQGKQNIVKQDSLRCSRLSGVMSYSVFIPVALYCIIDST